MGRPRRGFYDIRPAPPNWPIEQRIEHFAQQRTKFLMAGVTGGRSLPDTIAAAYLLGLNDAADALQSQSQQHAEQV